VTEPILKKVDAWWTVLLIDPLAMGLTRLVRTWSAVTPMRMTVLAHLLGVACAALFARGHLVAAAVLFEVRFVLDCADGKLARVRGTSSAAGAYVDYVGDYLVVALNATALAWYLHWADGLPLLGALGFPVAFLAHIVAGQARDIEAQAAGIGRRGGADAGGRYVRWMAARRLRPLPSRVDAEHVSLFVAPVLAVVLDRPGILLAVVWVNAAYFAYRAARMGVAGYLIAVQRDRDRPGGSG